MTSHNLLDRSLEDQYMKDRKTGRHQCHLEQAEP
jgi:hypothetical protein